MESSDDVEEIRSHEDDVGCFDGDIGSGAKSDSNICDSEGGRVVDTVSDLAHEHVSDRSLGKRTETPTIATR